MGGFRSVETSQLGRAEELAARVAQMAEAVQTAQAVRAAQTVEAMMVADVAER